MFFGFMYGICVFPTPIFKCFGGFGRVALPSLRRRGGLFTAYRISADVICGFMRCFCLLMCLFAYHQSAIYRRFRVGLCVEFYFVLVLNHLLECRVKCTGYCRVLAFKGGWVCV